MFIIKKESLKISKKLLVNFAMLVGPSSKRGGRGGVKATVSLLGNICCHIHLQDASTGAGNDFFNLML